MAIIQGYAIREENNSVPHKLYDCSIEDLNVRREKAMPFPSASAVAAYIGVPPHQMFRARVPGSKIYSKKLKKWFAVRIAKETK